MKTSREIRFRAWHRKAEVMEEVVSFHVGHYVETICNDGDHNEQYDYDQVILMQYTGLKDKNGVEIYEGDILRCDDNGENFGGHWNDDTDEWEPDNAYEIYWADMCYWLRDKNGSLDMEYSPFIDTEFEVIGNIHENPELLK